MTEVFHGIGKREKRYASGEYLDRCSVELVSRTFLVFFQFERESGETMSIEDILPAELCGVAAIVSGKCLLDITELDDSFSVLDRGADVRKFDGEKAFDVFEILFEEFFLDKEYNFRCYGSILDGSFRWSLCNDGVSPEKCCLEEVLEVVLVLECRIVS